MSAVSDDSLAFATIDEVGRLLRAQQVTSAALTRLMLDRIARHNPALNCFITVAGDGAPRQAAALDEMRQAGVDLGPLHGVPVAIKDNMATAGMRTTEASRILADWVPTEDATVVQRLKQAGAVILGKTNLYEFAYGGVHEDYGETHNPWNQGRTCSASSSGSACAVAAGLAYASLGSDTGGSVRLPAAACGIVGHKPTYGLVSRAGVLPAGYSLDHVGPFARSVRDAALVLNAIAGPDARDPAGTRQPAPDATAELPRGIEGLAVGVPQAQPSELIDPQMHEAFRAALAMLEAVGARLVEVELPDHLLSRTVMWAISASEMAESHRETGPLARRSHRVPRGAGVRAGDGLASPPAGAAMTATPAAAFKARLAAGPCAVMMNPDHPSARLVEFIATLGVHAVMIDTEQGSAGAQTVEEMARAARACGLCALVRVFAPESWVLERYLLRGVHCITARSRASSRPAIGRACWSPPPMSRPGRPRA